MEDQISEILKDMDHAIFKNEKTRKEFARLVIEQAKLERELFEVKRQITALKYKCS